MRFAQFAKVVLLLSASAFSFAAGPKQLAELTASDGTPTDGFGTSVAVNGDTIIVGAPYASIGSNSGEGAAYVFVKPSGGWGNHTEVAKLTPSDGSSDRWFGYSVAVDKDTIVIGSDDITSSSNVYVFVKPATGWKDMTETAEFTGPDYLGLSVAIAGNTIVAGASEGAYLYLKPKGGWASTSRANAVLTESDPVRGDNFGESVAISGKTVIVGAPARGNAGLGSASIFVKPRSGWTSMTQTATLTASDGADGDYFAFSVAITSGFAAVGAPNHRSGGPAGAGAVYVFVEPLSGWSNGTESAELTPPVPVYGGAFGWSVAMAGSDALGGSPFNNNDDEGVGYLYKKSKSGWETTSEAFAELLPSDPVEGDSFAISEAMQGGTIIVGASKVGEAPGAAYVF